MLAVAFLLAFAAPADSAACRAELERIAAEAREQGYEAVEGPYAVGPDDLRVHAVYAEGGGHRIVEHRCEAGRVVSRSWTASPDGADGPTPLESLLHGARWPEQGRRE